MPSPGWTAGWWRGIPVTEVPVQWTDQVGSSFHVWAHGRRVVSEVLAVRRSVGELA